MEDEQNKWQKKCDNGGNIDPAAGAAGVVQV